MPQHRLAPNRGLAVPLVSSPESFVLALRRNDGDRAGDSEEEDRASDRGGMASVFCVCLCVFFKCVYVIFPWVFLHGFL